MKTLATLSVLLLTSTLSSQKVDIETPPGQLIDIGGRKLHNPFSASPVVVLTRGLQMSNGLAENHAGLARVSKNSRHTVVADSGHEVHLFTPAAVIQAVQDVSTAIRQRSQLPPR